ncbi:amino acid permease [Anaerocolumna sedimenticola]|uniref:Amino acid permease n=1 Tax=Anaerocolumna sedimenticola TaxID=2696063 RepID=A0A6P1TIC8_9FIRM|nr:APC family permease [Anaerocolumna sedimenticola]QHQ60057.1 amino acid permease [Anaerocolumna sedimenticola]
MENRKEHYSLLTATTMIIGIVIGSGIFFKSDDVLKYTGGNIGLGILVLCIGAFSIIFGSLTLTELSMRTKKNGGFVGYYEEFISKGAACGFGWFQTFIYFPSLTAVVAWVSGIYTASLFGFEGTLENQIAIGFGFMTLLFLINILSLKLGGYFQNLTTIIKLIPLLGIALLGVFLGSANPEIPKGIEIIGKSNVGFGWLAALAPIAFSYDGWIIATSITNEVKKPQKNMPLALIIGPLVVLGVYLLYFLGITNMLGTSYIMSTGNDAVNKAGEILLGNHGSKIILIFIIISILGVVNGITLGSLRMPQALASKDMIPGSKKIAEIHPKYQLSLKSCLLSYIITLIWMVLHYITQKSGIIGSSDVSEIAIVFSYVCYIILYLKVMKMKKDKLIKSKFKGIICPVFGILGSVIILIGGIVSNPLYVPVFMLICLIVGGIGYYYYYSKKKYQR